MDLVLIYIKLYIRSYIKPILGYWLHNKYKKYCRPFKDTFYIRNEILVGIIMEQVRVIKKKKKSWFSHQCEKVMKIKSKLAFIAWINVLYGILPWAEILIQVKEEKYIKKLRGKKFGAQWFHCLNALNHNNICSSGFV